MKNNSPLNFDNLFTLAPAVAHAATDSRLPDANTAFIVAITNKLGEQLNGILQKSGKDIGREGAALDLWLWEEDNPDAPQPETPTLDAIHMTLSEGLSAILAVLEEQPTDVLEDFQTHLHDQLNTHTLANMSSKLQKLMHYGGSALPLLMLPVNAPAAIILSIELFCILGVTINGPKFFSHPSVQEWLKYAHEYFDASQAQESPIIITPNDGREAVKDGILELSTKLHKKGFLSAPDEDMQPSRITTLIHQIDLILEARLEQAKNNISDTGTPASALVDAPIITSAGKQDALEQVDKTQRNN